MTLALWHWHIEVSSKCTLKCPRCPRQEVPEGLINTELGLEFFWDNFPEEFIKNHVQKITFCGDNGDPIYAHDFLDIVKYLKNTKPSIEIVIVTNGSYRTPLWWESLGKLLDSQDSVHFSIDGHNNETNNQYRVNSEFDGIITGIRQLRTYSQCQIVWDAIAFKFNQDFIPSMKLLAQGLGVDRFQLTRSTKFQKIYPIYGPEDPLQPNDEYISSSFRFEREVTDFTNRETAAPKINYDLYNSSKVVNGVRSLCSIGNKGLYISATGDFYPCCWVANRYAHNSEWQKLGKRFNLYEQTLETVLKNEFWSGEFQTYRWVECKTKCDQALVDEKYATQW